MRCTGDVVTPLGQPVPDERWRLCQRNPLYQVSDLGRVKRTKNGRLLKPTMNSKQNKVGYFTVSLWHHNRGKTYYVHQLVAEAFLGPCPPGMNVDHHNENREDNSAANLRYLPELINSFRWRSRDEQGRNQWDSPYLGTEHAPEDHQPITVEESNELCLERAASGW